MVWYLAVGLTMLLLLIHIVVLPVDCDHVRYTITSHHARVKQAFNVLSLWNLSVLNCTEQCLRREQCRGINYSERYKLCEVLDFAEGDPVIYDFTESKFVHISRADIEDKKLNDVACSSCLHGVCDPADGICHIKECPKFRLVFGTWQGNRQSVGSKVTLNGCNPNHLLDGDVTSVCQENGTWRSDPSCLWDCGEPRSTGWGYWNQVLEPGATTNGTVRRYNCVRDFFLSRNRTFTHKDVTCHYGGTWDSGPRCVVDCNEALEASWYFAENRTGSGLQDYDERFYHCPAGLGVLELFPGPPRRLSRYDYVEYNGMVTHAPFKRIWCNGRFPAWADTNFKCTRVCTSWPDIKNVWRVYYRVWADYTMAELYCQTNYSAFRGDTILQPPTYAEILCNETGTDWQHVDFTCEIDCASHNISDINGDLTYVFQPNLTTVTHACVNGYAMSNGSTVLDVTERTGTCNEPGGKWQFENLDLTCVIACVKPPDLLNIGDIIYTFGPNETKATYACADDHVISDGRMISTDTEMEITCDTPGGDWNYTHFICLKNCVNPPTGMNIEHVTYTANATHTLAEHACADGHVVYDGSTLTSDTSVMVTCKTAGADWEHPGFICAKACGNTPSMANVASVTYTVNDIETTATYTCDPNHVIAVNGLKQNTDTNSVTCTTAGGSWRHNNFVCVAACDNPPSMTNVASVTYTVNDIGTTATYTCDPNHVIAVNGVKQNTDTKSITCTTAGGNWQDANFVCVAVNTDDDDSSG